MTASLLVWNTIKILWKNEKWENLRNRSFPPFFVLGNSELMSYLEDGTTPKLKIKIMYSYASYHSEYIHNAYNHATSFVF